MRIVGFLFLFGGFACLCLGTASISPITRAVVIKRSHQLPAAPDATYSREDIQKEMRDTTLEAVGRYPSFLYPGIAMLAGGLLLAFARRKPTLAATPPGQ